LNLGAAPFLLQVYLIYGATGLKLRLNYFIEEKNNRRSLAFIHERKLEKYNKF
jgi:hypothetical protein